MDRIVRELKKCTLFSDLPEQVVSDDILPRGQIQLISRGQYLINPQEQLNHFGVLLQGKINTMHIFADGNYRIMEALEKYEVFGADLMCTKSRISPYHAVAAQESQMIFFPISMILQPGTLTEANRLIILNQLLTLIAHENMRKEYRLAILSRKGLRERIMTYLTMQADKRGTDTFTIPFSREELASFLCVNRSALSHELSRMEQEGVLSFHKNRFTLCDMEQWYD